MSFFWQIFFGCAAQYTIMPVFGAIIGKAMGLSPALSVGLILLACCPGGTASNVVRYLFVHLNLNKKKKRKKPF